jgi:flagellar biosynthesis anti-sigma factor FlgM
MMKIQGNSPNHDTAAAAAARLEATRADRQARTERRGAEGGDRVDVSTDAQLVGQAVKAVENAPAIRHDVVERARQKLMAGEIGGDSLKLADRLIDHLLER